jgi:hypothetical protein
MTLRSAELAPLLLLYTDYPPSRSYIKADRTFVVAECFLLSSELPLPYIVRAYFLFLAITLCLNSFNHDFR